MKIQLNEPFTIQFILLNLIIYKTYQVPEIYGVRWMLGNDYSFKLPQQGRLAGTKYIVGFNSDEHLNGNTVLEINYVKYSCTERFLDLDRKFHNFQAPSKSNATLEQFSSYIHLCYVNTHISYSGNQIPYYIKSTQTKYDNTQKGIIFTQKIQTILFNGSFRPIPMKDYQVIVIGDWGQISQKVQQQKKYVPIIDCVISTLQKRKSISAFFFVGDLAYNFQGKLYKSMLKYMEPIINKIIWIGVPGNHDVFHRGDSFLIFHETFQTPLWDNYHNYFFTAQLPSNLVIIGFNPELEIKKKSRMQKQIDLPEIFKQQLHQKRRKYLKDHKIVFAISHYPTFCSNIYDPLKSCDLDEQRFGFYLKYLNEVGLDLYLSGHVHVYQRMKPICYRQNLTQKLVFGNTWLHKCPIYILEGSGGNNYYVQTQNLYEQKQYSQKIVLNTGFGIISINEYQESVNVKYQHYSAQKCDIADSVKLQAHFTNLNNQANSKLLNFSTNLIFISIAGIAICIIMIVCFYLKRYRTKTSITNCTQDNIQLVALVNNSRNNCIKQI